jgi:signal transduction histidine kinase
MNQVSEESAVYEFNRVTAVRRYDILDTPPDGSFDNITKLAAQLLDVPIALITIVDTDRIWFKSSFGLDVTQIGRDPGLCASAILANDIFVVENAVEDVRTLTNPLVAGEFGLRFYAAVPLTVREGYNLGTLCIIDRSPRILQPAEKKILVRLAEIVTDQLELRMEARKAYSEQKKVLSIVAHELKNPLTTIPIYAELIRQHPDSGKVVEMSENIIRSAKRMTELVEDILETGRMQAADVNFKQSNVDLSVVIQKTIAQLRVLSDKKHQEISEELPAALVVRGDESKLAKIVENLLGNAIKYSGAGAKVMVSLTASNNKAVLRVSDEGPGFSEKDKENLYRPFTRLSAIPTAGEHSTGMGLYIVKTLVEAHNGSVRLLANDPGHGSTFEVSIPLDYTRKPM